MKRFLSHHEIAALILLASAPTQALLDQPDLDALVQENLAELIRTGSGNPQAKLTQAGAVLLRRLGRIT